MKIAPIGRPRDAVATSPAVTCVRWFASVRWCSPVLAGGIAGVIAGRSWAAI